MATFAALDKRMMRDVNRIHDYLWDSAVKIDGAKLLADLTREARELDALLKAGGTLRRHAESLARDTAKDKDRHGGALYALLYDTYNPAPPAARTFGKGWDARAPKEQQGLAARAALQAAAWCAVASRSISEAATGRPSRVPIRDFAAGGQKIAARL